MTKRIRGHGSVVDKANRVRFFKETFLVANVSPKVVFGIPFLTLSGVNVDFSGRELRWRTYTTEKALLTTKRIVLVGKKKFATAILNPEHETYVVHVTSLSTTSLVALDIHLSRRPQISGLIAEKTPKKVPTKYSDFADVFSPDLASALLKHTGINDHAIELVDANGFIRLSNAPIGAPIFFKRKSERFFWLCVDCRSLNNLTIAMSALMARTVKIAIISLTLLDKLGKF